MTGKVLHVSERHAGVESSGDGAMTQAVRAEPVGGRTRLLSEPAHQTPGGRFREALVLRLDWGSRL